MKADRQTLSAATPGGKRRFQRQSGSEQAFLTLNYAFLTVILLLVAYPVLFIISSSFSSPDAVTKGKIWLLPVEPSLEGYRAVYRYDKVWLGYANSLLYMVAGTTLNVFMTVLAAYPLSRQDFYGRRAVIALFTFTIFFNGGLIPTYLLVRGLGLLNTRLALILPGAMAVWNVIITRTFFMTTMPQSLLEAAQMDGCSDFRYLWSIVLPLSGPILAVNALFYAVGHWNQYFAALIYLREERLYPLQLFLREVLVLNQADDPSMMNIEELERRLKLQQLLKYSLIIVASFPVMAIYPFVQKYFVKGVMIGSLKG